MMSFDANANDIYRLIPFRTYRQSTTQTTAINSIFACDEDICQSEFGVRHRRGDTLYATTDAVVGSAAGTANVLSHQRCLRHLDQCQHRIGQRRVRLDAQGSLCLGQPEHLGGHELGPDLLLR
jgi:hypothetical protein